MTNDRYTLHHKWELPSTQIEGFAPDAGLAERREMMEDLPKSKPAANVAIQTEVVGGISCLTCTPAAPKATFLYLHGGGYRLGSPERSAPFASHLAAALGSKVVVGRYRLAPENPFPSGLLDVISMYDDLRSLLDSESVDSESLDSEIPQTLGVIGDSAGGGLAAGLTNACIDSQVPVPDQMILMSPWLDLSLAGDSIEGRADTEQLFPPASARDAVASYLQGQDPQHPWASPLFGDLTQFPPTLVFASTDEILMDDSIRLVNGLANARVKVSASFIPDVVHAWPAIFPDGEHTPSALAHMTQFVQEHR